jgi:AraC-like DNA-binding protein
MVTALNDFSVFRFSTANVPPAERVPLWHEVFGRSVSRRFVCPPPNGPLHVEMTVHSLARAGVGSNICGGACVMRMALEHGGIARRTSDLLSDGNDDVILHVQEAGRRVVSQLGREAVIGPGGALLTSNGDMSTIVLPEATTRLLAIAIPRKAMMALAPRLEDAFVRPLPQDAGVLRLLMIYLGVLDDDQALATPELRHLAATHIQDLCGLAVGVTRDAAEIANGRGLRAARLRAVKADIEAHLADEGLSTERVAQRQRVTPRYIRMLFESEGTTFSRYVLGQRLARVHRMLSDLRRTDLTISAMAYRAGFSDLSRFNREFRRHFGATPSEVRAAARKA